MRRGGGGIGFIVVIIATAIVMILAMRAWLSVAPTAQLIMNPSLAAAGKGGKGKATAKGVPDHGQKEASDQVQKGVLPDLSDMKQGTDQHAKEVEDAVKETNK